MTKLDSVLKSRDITLPTKVHIVKAMAFPVVRYSFESRTVKKAECQRIDAFFMVQLSQQYVTTGKTIGLTIQTFVGRVMSLHFNTPSSFVIAFLPRSNYLVISWLQSPSTVILEPKKRKSVTTSTFSSSICHAVMGPDAMTLVIFNLYS